MERFVKNSKRVLAGVAAAAVAGGLMLSATTPAMAATNVHHISATKNPGVRPNDVYGPYSSDYDCVAQGDFGIFYGYWTTFDCYGNGNVWYLYTY